MAVLFFTFGLYRGENPALPHPAWGLIPLGLALALVWLAWHCARHAYILLSPIGVEIFPFFQPAANMQVIPWAQIAAADIDDARLTLHFSAEKTAGIHLSLAPVPKERRELLAKEGILGGSSTGTLLAAALKYCREQKTSKRVLVLVCDTGNKYLSKMYNDYWMLDNGFLERTHYGDLRDLILRPYSQRDTVVVGPAEPLTTAYQRMKLYDVSQLPVMDGDKIVGIVDESDVLLHVYGDESKFRDPVSTAMASRLQMLDVKSPIESLLKVFEAGRVAIVMDGEKFLGLITRIDLLNYLRRRVQ